MMSRVDAKVVLLGKSYVGKTCLVNKFVHERFDPNLPYQNVSTCMHYSCDVKFYLYCIFCPLVWFQEFYVLVYFKYEDTYVLYCNSNCVVFGFLNMLLVWNKNKVQDCFNKKLMESQLQPQ